MTTPNAGAATLKGNDSQNIIFGTNKTDRIKSLDGNDYVFAKKNPNDARDKVDSGDGPDTIVGGLGKDQLSGGAGADLVFDGDGKPGDRLFGGTEDDVMSVADGSKDSADCGPGTDTVYADPVDTLVGCEAVATGSGTHGSIVVVFGTEDADNIIGNDASNVLLGLRGDDTLTGAGGTDHLVGGPGVDTLNGDGGGDALTDGDSKPGDVLNGGDGVDWFYAADGAADTIDCGGGDGDTDVVLADLEDTLENCESDTVFVGSKLILS